jgi:murein L,D-transpeptidase YcbB/YkuD
VVVSRGTGTFDSAQVITYGASLPNCLTNRVVANSKRIRFLGTNEQHQKTGANMSRALRSCFALTLVLAFLISSVAIHVTAQINGPVGQDPSAAGVAAIRDIIHSAQLPDLRWRDFSLYRSEVARFYASDGYSLAWIRRGQPRPQALALIHILRDADSKGLNAEDYDGPRWPDRLANLRGSVSESDLVRFDVALTVSTMRYIRAVHFGRVNPKVFKFELDVENTKYDLADFLRALALSSSDLTTLLRRLEPSFPEYDRLLACLPFYLRLENDRRAERIRLALERWRWVSRRFSQHPLVINIPEFRLLGTDESGKVTVFMPVTLDKDYALRSPTFEGELKDVVFRPYWQVAPNIEQHEIIPHIEKDRNFLLRNRFEIVAQDGTVITGGVVSDPVIDQLRAGKLHVRQKPGPRNSIGLVKLSLSNSENVYLHGADEPQPIPHKSHGLSHGCIRVQEGAALAAWVLRDNPGWNLDRVRALMNGRRGNIQVNPTAPTPVLIIYGTAAVDEAGEVHFSDDIYGYDAKLEQALAKGYTAYPW